MGMFDMFKSHKKTVKKSNGKKRVKAFASKVGRKAKDIGVHDIVGRPRSEKERQRNIKSNKRATKRIMKSVKKKLFW